MYSPLLHCFLAEKARAAVEHEVFAVERVRAAKKEAEKRATPPKETHKEQADRLKAEKKAAKGKDGGQSGRLAASHTPALASLGQSLKEVEVASWPSKVDKDLVRIPDDSPFVVPCSGTFESKISKDRDRY